MSIKLDTHDDLLKTKIKFHHQHMLEARQLLYRLRKLQPSRMKAIQQQQEKSDANSNKIKSFSRANSALASDELAESIDQMSEVSYEAAYHKVMYETHLMLFNARQTLASFQKQVQISRLDSSRRKV